MTRILLEHIIPNVVPIILVETVMRTAIAMLTEASLSLLGFGDPIAKSWGTILHFAMIKNTLILGLWW